MSEIYDKDGNLINNQSDSLDYSNVYDEPDTFSESSGDVDNSSEAENSYTVNSVDSGSSSDSADANPAVSVSSDNSNAAYSSNNFGSQSPRNYNYYNENYKTKDSGKKVSIAQLIAVALISAIIGGMIFSAAFMFVVPRLQAPFSQLLGKNSDVNTQNPVQLNIPKSDPTVVSAVAKKVGPSVVGIRLTMNVPSSNPFSFGQSQQGTSEGSGIIFKSDGYIVTNNHVIEEAYNTVNGSFDPSAKIEVFLPSDPNKPLPATVVGRNSKTDIAVLKIDATNLPTAEFGDSDAVIIGETAITIGNPGGMELMGTVTAGVISGLNRTITIDNNKMMKLIQTDASINSGNSGGALVNAQGQVIGINTIKIGGQGYEGLGFAIPINTVKTITDSIINKKYIPGKPLLGVSFDTRFTSDYAKQNNLPEGLLVADVTLMGGAQKAGIKIGDIVTKFDKTPVSDYDKIVELISDHKPGDTVSVEFYRDTDKKTYTVNVTLTESKD